MVDTCHSPTGRRGRREYVNKRRAAIIAIVAALLAAVLVTGPSSTAIATSDVPPLPPAKATAVAGAGGSATVRWTAPTDASRVRFALYVGDRQLGWWGTRLVSKSATSVVVKGLLPGHAYWFAVFAQS